MRHAIATGTDAAMVAVFDPAALPPDFDEQVANDVLGTLSAMRAHGRLWFTGTGGDGEYLVRVYVDEDPPDDVLSACRDADPVPGLAVPSGHVWAAGAEFLCREPQTRLHPASELGGSFDVPAGTYDAVFWRTEFPERHADRTFAARFGDDALRAKDRGGPLMGFGIVATLLVAIPLAFALRELGAWAYLPLGLTVATGLLGVVLWNLPGSHAARERWRTFRREVSPSVVVRLRRSVAP